MEGKITNYPQNPITVTTRLKSPGVRSRCLGGFGTGEKGEVEVEAPGLGVLEVPTLGPGMIHVLIQYGLCTYDIFTYSFKQFRVRRNAIIRLRRQPPESCRQPLVGNLG